MIVLQNFFPGLIEEIKYAAYSYSFSWSDLFSIYSKVILVTLRKISFDQKYVNGTIGKCIHRSNDADCLSGVRAGLDRFLQVSVSETRRCSTRFHQVAVGKAQGQYSDQIVFVLKRPTDHTNFFSTWPTRNNI